jgi:hypothetical protein
MTLSFKQTILVSSFLVLSLFTTVTLAYFYQTHAFLGAQLQYYLYRMHPRTYSAMNETLEGEVFSKASVWADQIKSNPAYAWSRDLHFVDVDVCQPSEKDITSACNGHCIISGLMNFTSQLKNVNTPETQKKEALKFSLHLLQDLHQPLHNLGTLRGGNDCKVNVEKSDGKIEYNTNLHAVWDGDIPEYFTQTTNYTYNGTEIEYDFIYNYTDFEYNDFNSTEMKEIEDETALYEMLIEAVTSNVIIACNETGIPELCETTIEFAEYYKADIVQSLFDRYIQTATRWAKMVFDDTE